MKSKTQAKSVIPNFTPISSSQLQHTKWLFFALCCYLLSQSFTVPILPIGPWAIWPGFCDFAFFLLVFTFIQSRRYTTRLSIPNQKIFSILIIIFLGCIQSYLCYLASADENANGAPFGAFQLYRLVQYFSLFWLIGRIPLTAARLQVMRQIVDGVLIFVCLGVFLTYAGVVPLSLITAHLPKIGAWQFYEGVGKIGTKGLGFVGYNHAYVAAQVTMLLILRLHLGNNEKKDLSNTILLVISTLTVFISESRSGFGAMLFLLFIYLTSKPIYALCIVNIALILPVLASAFGSQSIEVNSIEGSIIDRQLTVFQANKTENLSGRDELWAAHLNALDENQVNWFVGNGFGSAIDRGNNAHMLYLQITSETGLIGLCIFSVLFSIILFYLYKTEIKEKPFFWGTITFLITAFSQETFYPQPAFGHFLGLYMSSVAIILRTPYLIEDSLPSPKSLSENI
ncbi:O-antigen ligase [Tychonema sp. BBK16]|uniref:O-antigen ligase family protein n=1 Tax=Tychonema sp. BBK16 TaxID=2699888 RepID=UPI001F275C8A|nr:O-antigen ligase family protein [Tychonema sp. BBK16]MCF6372671.1 O-antigen ligase family protein [Tychonema sp. BBK16]